MNKGTLNVFNNANMIPLWMFHLGNSGSWRLVLVLASQELRDHAVAEDGPHEALHVLHRAAAEGHPICGRTAEADVEEERLELVEADDAVARAVAVGSSECMLEHVLAMQFGQE
jgi:hypothetical protein